MKNKKCKENKVVENPISQSPATARPEYCDECGGLLKKYTGKDGFDIHTGERIGEAIFMYCDKHRAWLGLESCNLLYVWVKDKDNVWGKEEICYTGDIDTVLPMYAYSLEKINSYKGQQV